MTLDTNILIAYLGGEERVIKQIREWRRNRIPLFVSSITECEVLSYPKLSSNEEQRIERFLRENFIAIPFEGSLAREAAALRRRNPALKLPDAAIAALALRMSTPLITRNLRDFRNIPSLATKPL